MEADEIIVASVKLPAFHESICYHEISSVHPEKLAVVSWSTLGKGWLVARVSNPENAD